MPIDITRIPEIMGNFLGVDAIVMGIIISIAITIAVLMGLAILEINTIGIVIGGAGMLALFTVLTWFPLWVMLPIGVIAAVVVSGEIKKVGKK